MNEFLTIFGTIVTVLSAVYAVYANRKTAKIVDYNREQSWELYRMASNVLARCQALEGAEHPNPQFMVDSAKAEVAATELTMSTIRMIKRFEEDFSKKRIQAWLEEGKVVNESHLKPFLNLANK